MSIRGYFLWHELLTPDPQAAVAFYQRVIGWQKQKWEQDPSYTILAYQNAPMAGVMELPEDAKAMNAPPHWMAYIGTPDVEITAWDAQRLGAKLLKGPVATPTVGKWAILSDPQGAVFAAYTPEQTPKVGAEPAIGDFSWHELATTSYAAALDFYRELFGWQKTGSFDMGPAGTYLMYGFGKQRLGGMYTLTGEQGGTPAHWLSYIRVPDVKPVTKAIQSAGGAILNGPMEVPGGDWVTMAKDPQGAVFAVHQKKAKAAKSVKPAPKKVTRKKAAAKKTAKKTATKRPAKRAKAGKRRR
ncbi:MAG: VOC family protein [Gemmatimonadetes bacterium]|nr:VOC family protein [Gemmatimonadota bacterium]